MVNDHMVYCFRYSQISQIDSSAEIKAARMILFGLPFGEYLSAFQFIIIH